MTRLGIASDQRHREYMEDRVVTGMVRDALVVGLFDGHGGSVVAEHAAARTVELVDAVLAGGLAGDDLWRSVFAGLDLDSAQCGSTATLLLIRDHELSCAWVGDSRAIAVGADGWRVLAPDHRLENAPERERVVAAGAVLMPPYAVDPSSEYGLMVTRSLGDRELRRIGITAEPEVRAITLADSDVGFVVATDGLWDVVSNTEAAAVCRSDDPQAAAARLVELVIARDGTDNVTVVVGRFTPPGRAASG